MQVAAASSLCHSSIHSLAPVAISLLAVAALLAVVKDRYPTSSPRMLHHRNHRAVDRNRFTARTCRINRRDNHRRRRSLIPYRVISHPVDSLVSPTPTSRCDTLISRAEQVRVRVKLSTHRMWVCLSSRLWTGKSARSRINWPATAPRNVLMPRVGATIGLIARMAAMSRPAPVPIDWTKNVCAMATQIARWLKTNLVALAVSRWRIRAMRMPRNMHGTIVRLCPCAIVAWNAAMAS